MPRRATPPQVKMAFEEAKIRIAITQIQPLKLVSAAIKKTPKYAQIAASIREVGIVEPPVVARDHKRSRYRFLFLGSGGRGKNGGQINRSRRNCACRLFNIFNVLFEPGFYGFYNRRFHPTSLSMSRQVPDQGLPIVHHPADTGVRF